MEEQTRQTATLLISCPDQKGIVAAVSDFIYKNNGNILHADEHLDSELNLFLLRVEWDLNEFTLNEEEFNKSFSEIAGKFSMDWQYALSTKKKNTAILVSKDLHCLSDLLYKYKANELFCNISLIISNHPDAKELAEFYKIPFFEFPNKSEEELLKLLKTHNIDLVILARYMQILSDDFVNEYPNKIINIHHSFLPSFIGAKPYHQAYQRGVKLIGATSHYVTAELDEGPIIEQDVIRISHRDIVSDLVQKGKDVEKGVLSKAVKAHLENKILVYQKKTVVFN